MSYHRFNILVKIINGELNNKSGKEYIALTSCKDHVIILILIKLIEIVSLEENIRENV